MAINDIVEDLAEILPADVIRFDKVTSAAELITLSGVRHRYSFSFKQVGKRSLIGDETEHQLINGIVVDQSSEIDAEERKLLQQLLDAHE